MRVFGIITAGILALSISACRTCTFAARRCVPSDEARGLAQQWLNKIAVPGGIAFDLPDPTTLTRATLGEPAIFYWAGDCFADYETAPAPELLQHVRCTIRYPVELDGKVIGAINILEELDGNLKTAGLDTGDRFSSALAAKREILRPKEGQRVSGLDLQAAGAGLYAIADDGEHIFGLVPVEEDASRFVEHAVGNKGASIVVTLAAIAEQIKANLRVRREARERNRSGIRPDARHPGRLDPQVAREHYSLVYADLGLRVTITQLKEHRVLPSGMGIEVPHELPSYARAAVMIVEAEVDEVMRGGFAETNIRFAVPWGDSDFEHNYTVGDEAVVSLVMRRDVLGGMWTLFFDSGRYLKRGDSWVVQGGRNGGTAYTLTTIRAIAASVSLDRVIRDADAIVVGRITDTVRHSVYPTPRSVVRLVRARFVLDRAVVGDVDKTISVEWAYAGAYWPDWRVDGPDTVETGGEYLLFLSRQGSGFVPTYGKHGIVVVHERGVLENPNGVLLPYTLADLDARIHAVR